MRPDRQVTGDRRSWLFWAAIVVVIAATVALIAWTFVQTGAVREDVSVGPGSAGPTTVIAVRAI